MAQTNNTPAKQAPKSIANFLNFPATNTFLEQNLREKRGEFVSNLIALCENDSNLSKCDPKAVMMCAMHATGLNLPLNKNLGLAYVIAYKGKPSFQIGYKGYIQLALRSGHYKYINACEVREGEINFNKFSGSFQMVGTFPDRPVVGYLAFLQLNNGFEHCIYSTVEEMEAHARRYSKAYQYDLANETSSSKWSDPEEKPKMAKKTVLKSLLGTWGIMTTEMSNAFSADENSDDESATGRFRNAEDVIPIIPQADPSDPNPQQGQEGAQPKKVQI